MFFKIQNAEGLFSNGSLHKYSFKWSPKGRMFASRGGVTQHLKLKKYEEGCVVVEFDGLGNTITHDIASWSKKSEKKVMLKTLKDNVTFFKKLLDSAQQRHLEAEQLLQKFLQE